MLFTGAAIASQFCLPLVYCYNLKIEYRTRIRSNCASTSELKGFEGDLKGCWRILGLAHTGSPGGEMDLRLRRGFISHWVLHWKGDSFNRGERYGALLDGPQIFMVYMACYDLILLSHE
jgi:hypothetical protein